MAVPRPVPRAEPLPEPLPVLAEVVRSGFVESRHVGSLVVLRPDGSTALALGTPEAPVFPRSSNKPMQAAGMLRAGLGATAAAGGRPAGGMPAGRLPAGGLPADLLAIAAASHSGEPVHIDAVRRLLATAGLDEASLANTPDLPLDQQAAWAVLRAGGGPDHVYQNCSGKHAAMVATCVAAGWPVEGYLAAGHPLQVALRGTLEELAAEPVAAVGVDGCGAPVFAITLRGLAVAFRAMVLAADGTPERRVADAMRARPELVGGTGRDVTALMSGVPGLLAKDGAEGVYAAATADGGAIALKVDDGASRARAPIMVAALRLLGVDAADLAELASVPVLGHGRPVGEVHALDLTAHAS